MLRNYFKIAIRSLFRTRLYSFINIAGLSLGIACCIMLGLYVHDELQYDRHHRRLNDLYRIDTQFYGVVGFDKLGTCSPPIAPALLEELPEVEAVARIIPTFSENLIQYKDKKFYESAGFVADSTLFDVLTYEFIEGNPGNALVDANTVVISESMSKKLFGDESALDKSILITQGYDPVNYKITGVYKQQKSFQHANFFTSIMSEGMGKFIRTDPQAVSEWAGQNFVTACIRLSPGHDRLAVEKKMNEVLIRHGSEDLKALGLTKTLFLEPVKDIYLRSMVDSSQRITYIYVIFSIAAFILVLACINFINLSTAKATKRAAEIGVRKVVGAVRSSLIGQILGETMLIVLISIFIGVALVFASLSLFNEVSGKEIILSGDTMLFTGLALLVLAVVIGLIAGGYPAFYMSSFQPAVVLKGKFNLSSTSAWLRQGLVVFQFTVAIALVCGMLVISRQLSFMKEKDLGFNPVAKIVIPLRTPDARGNYQTLKAAMEQMSSVEKVSATDAPPGTLILSDMSFYLEGRSMESGIINKRNEVDAGYMELMGIDLIAGRTFTTDKREESPGNVIINRASADKFGIAPEEMVGRKLYYDWQGELFSFQVIGVMENYNQNSLKEPIVPIIFERPEDNRFDFIVASVNLSGFSSIIASMEKVWQEQVSDAPFEYAILDDNIQQQYNEDERISKIISAFAVVAMIICSLGLYGLSSFMAERRTKEIGIRKVMGASVAQIMGMMSKEFVKLVLLAFAFAVPLSWYSMNQWLRGFEYRTSLDIWIFVVAGLGALGVALFTISSESFKAASINPARTLKSD